MPAEVRCLVWRTCRQMVLVQLAAALAHPASDQVLALMRQATKMMIALSLFWTRSLRTRTPIRTQCRATAWGRGGLGSFNLRHPLVNHHGDPETTGVGEAP